jgi:hypothetical protein
MFNAWRKRVHGVFSTNAAVVWPLTWNAAAATAVVVTRSASGQVQAVKSTVVSGFVRAGWFYTREEATEIVA